ncbi:hypothetical protein GCM10027280_39540 [Micromonospora polyrhachis]|uniref:WD40 repeat protein n=1 Tax=Micromonospora polyrhachis TaxID=1282883 RepID=A0A7W7WQA0_9ACTN|nr:hypothetical protein [Micromonospora polyrhachis]MBB4959810.1 hypothetical protein [Micromonospora polyrhachis]
MTVTPDDLEQALRDSLSRQVAMPPGTFDLAAATIRRANRVRRRRSFAGAALAILATIAGSAGMAQFGGGGPADQSEPIVVLGDPPTATESAFPNRSAAATPGPDGRRGRIPTDAPLVDIVVATDLSTAGGEALDLAPIGEVVRAQRVSGGWLVVGAASASTQTLWFVTRSGPPKAVVSDVDVVTLSPDGQRIAWRKQTQLYAATVANGQVSTGVQSPAPAEATPVGFVGVAVLLRRDSDAGATGYDLWWPSSPEPYQPGWNTTMVGYHGVLPDGHTVVGRVSMAGSTRPCLGLLDAARDLAPVRTTCALPLDPDGRGTLSPDGRWLLVDGESAPDARVTALAVDLNTAFERTPAVRPAGSPVSDATVWTDSRTVVHFGEQGELVRVALDWAVAGVDGGVQRFPGPSLPPGSRPVLVSGPVD